MPISLPNFTIVAIAVLEISCEQVLEEIKQRKKKERRKRKKKKILTKSIGDPTDKPRITQLDLIRHRDELGWSAVITMWLQITNWQRLKIHEILSTFHALSDLMKKWDLSLKWTPVVPKVLEILNFSIEIKA